MSEEQTHYDVIIVGSGPAGFSAAVYASRANFSVLQLEGEQPGGQLTTTTDVENFIGFPEGVNGPQLMQRMREQVQRFGTTTKFEIVTEIIPGDMFTVKTSGKEYTADAVIVATGARSRRLGLESENRLWSRGVTSCATCDGAFFKDKEVVVVGGGDSAMEEANFLTNFATKVTILNRSDSFKASAIMLKRAQNNPKIEIMSNVQVLEVLGEEKMTGVKLKNTQSGEESELAADGLFLAIGHIPNTELVKDLVDLDDLGFIKPGITTKTPGLFAAGDVQDHKYRQAITAAGSGCQAALEAQWFIEHKRG